MAATEKAELVAHETDRWLNGHQEFDNLELVHSLVSEAEVGWLSICAHVLCYYL